MSNIFTKAIAWILTFLIVEVGALFIFWMSNAERGSGAGIFALIALVFGASVAREVSNSYTEKL